MHTGYNHFRDVPVGHTFGYAAPWTKQSTRTVGLSGGRWFYFSPDDLVYIRQSHITEFNTKAKP